MQHPHHVKVNPRERLLWNSKINKQSRLGIKAASFSNLLGFRLKTSNESSEPVSLFGLVVSRSAGGVDGPGVRFLRS